jgi:cellulose synthase/poly-beta-1,6-N-acetylglucosamine synthase-like glycosyltransferase
LKNFITGLELHVLIVSGLFILTFLVQAYFYLRFYRRAFYRKSTLNDKPVIPNVPVSIIICARNESVNLEKNLPLVLDQDYPDFEVIVVNDRSEDETEDILKRFSAKYGNLHISEVRHDPKFTTGKKLALTLGIKAASNEWLLLTDADCCPDGRNWLSRMQRNFRDDKDIVIGYGAYRRKKGFLNLLIRFDTLFNAMQYIGMATAGKPYMGVGRNLAYRKTLFFANKGFASHSNLFSGDDDLFVNETANSKNVAVELHPESFTWSDAEDSFKNWARQKKRHLTTGSRYRTAAKFRLIIENLSRFLFIASFVYLMFTFLYWQYVLIAFGVLYILKGIVYKIVFTRLNESFLFLPSLIIEPLIPLLYSYLHISNLTERKRRRWN